MSGVCGLPATKRPASVTWTLENNVAVAQDPLGNAVQRIMRSGGRWKATLDWPPMQGDDAGIFAGWLDRVARGDRWLYLDNPGHTIRGALTVTDLVADTYPTTGATDGWFAESGVTLSVNARRLKVANASGSPAVAAGAYRNITMTANVPHVVVVDFDPGDTQSATVQIRNATTFVVEASQKLTAGPDRFCFTVTPSQAAMQIRVVCNSDGHIYFRNITVTRCALVNGASQSGNRLNVDGLPVSTNALIKAGEFFCVKAGGSFELHRLRDDLDSDSGGAGALVFEPALRASPADNEPIVLYRPFARFFVPTHSAAASITPPGDKPIWGMTLDALEDVTSITDVARVADETGVVIWEFDASTLSLTPTEGSGTPTFTRSGATATRVNASGLIETVAADTPRFDYDPVTLAIRGMLIEEARTNLALYSEQFDNAAWTKTACSVTANAAVAPDGATTMDKLVEDSTNTQHYITQSVTTVAAGAYTHSVVAAPAGRNWIRVAFATNAWAWFDLANGVVGTVGAAATAASIESMGNGRYRCSISTAAVGTSSVAYIFTATGDGVVSYAGDGTSGVYLWGDQIEAGSFPTSYIPTTSAAATRNADACSTLLSAIADFNYAAWSLFTEWRSGGAGAINNDAEPAGLSSGSNDTTAFRETTANTGWMIRKTGQSAADISLGGAIVAGSTNRGAAAIAPGDAAFSLNGSAASTSTPALVPPITSLSVGGNLAGTSSWLNGHVRKVRLYSRRLTNAQLQAMTA